MNNNDTLSLYLSKDNISQLGILIENGENSQTTYNLNLIDIDEQDINIPDLNLIQLLQCHQMIFKNYYRAHNIYDVIEIISINNQLTFNLTGDWCTQQTIIGESEHTGLSYIQQLDETEITQGRYSLKYLILFTKATNLSSSVELYLKNDYPLILKYSIANLGSIKLALAPLCSVE